MVYVHNSTAANRKLAFGFWNGNEPFAIYNDSLSMSKPLEITATGGTPLKIYNGAGDNYI